MESVYFYDKKIEKDVLKTLKEDEFMRVSYIVRDSNTLFRKEGCIIYIQANLEETDSIEKKFKDLGVEKITGVEEKKIIEMFKTEEANAAIGMGMIFGQKWPDIIRNKKYRRYQKAVGKLFFNIVIIF